MGYREEQMRAHQIWTCPAWCTQEEGEDGEAGHESHLGPFVQVEIEHGDSITVRAMMSWWGADDDRIRVITTDTDLYIKPAALPAYIEALEDAAGLIEDGEDDAQWAYPGAEQDKEAAENGDDGDDVVDGDVVEADAYPRAIEAGPGW
jgi:hypothetical protein